MINPQILIIAPERSKLAVLGMRVTSSNCPVWLLKSKISLNWIRETPIKSETVLKKIKVMINLK
ncbi:hypothetical protein D920_01019 [Enterococcus faecalis 13-SD-W-01]|nr:hypothetical protein D920_01019 [Enterococcus faecalis 13-SD-W-01]